MTAEDQAFHMGQAWEALPEPKRQFNFYVVGPDGETKVFYIGPHAPTLSPDDVQLVHRLWLNMRRDPSVPDLHHSDIITYALTRLAGQYAREKAEILRDLRNYRASESPTLRIGGQDLDWSCFAICRSRPGAAAKQSSPRGLIPIALSPASITFIPPVLSAPVIKSNQR